jgi:hypothetical protein
VHRLTSNRLRSRAPLGRVEAAKVIGLSSVPVIHIEHLSREQIRVYETGWSVGRLEAAGDGRNSVIR